MQRRMSQANWSLCRKISSERFEMEGAVTWHVNQYSLVGITLAIFAFVGLRRGISRELLSMVGIGLGMLLANVLAPILGPQVNRFYRLGRFALGGGLAGDDPTEKRPNR